MYRAFEIASLLGAGGILLTSSSAFSGSSYKLLDCFEAALTRAESVQIQDNQIDQAEARYKQSLSEVMPTLSGVGNFSKEHHPQKADELGKPERPKFNATEKLMLNQSLFSGFRSVMSIRQKNTLIEASKSDREQAVILLYNDVAALFFTILSLERDVENIKTEMDMYDQRIAELQRFQKIGRSRTSEVLSVQSSKTSLDASLRQVKWQVRSNRDAFAVITGLDSNIALDKESQTPPVVPLENALSKIDERPDVVGAKTRIDASSDAIKIARGSHLPSVDLTGNYYFRRPDADRDVKWDVMLNVSVPIFSGGMVAAQVSEAVAQKSQNENSLDKNRQDAEREMRKAFDAISNDQEQIEVLTQATKLAEETYNEEQKEYRLGLVTNLDVISALQTFQESKRSLDRMSFTLLQDIHNYLTTLGKIPGRDATPAPAGKTGAK